MSNLFTILPFSVNNPSLPVIPSSDYERLSEFEINAYEHWLFDKGSSSGLTGEVNGRILTVQSTAPTYSASNLSISGNQGAGLLTDLGEVAGQTDTICVVFKHSASTGIVVPFGTLSSTADAALGGGGPFIDGATRDLKLQYRATSINSTDTGKDAPAATWHFLAVSRNMATRGVVRTLLSGQALHEVTVGGTAYIPAGNSRKIGLGSAYYATPAGSTLDFAEAVVFDRQLSATELAGVYTRAKARMAARGITVV